LRARSVSEAVLLSNIFVAARRGGRLEHARTSEPAVHRRSYVEVSARHVPGRMHTSQGWALLFLAANFASAS